MKYTWKQALGWIVGYMVVVLLPLWISTVGEVPPKRNFFVEFGVGLGFVGLTLMVLQFFFTGRFRRAGQGFGLDNVLQFHRQAGIVGFFILLAYPIVLISANRGYLAYFDPTVNLLRALFLGGMVLVLVTIIGTTLWRQALKIPYEWWRLLHGLLAFYIIFVGLTHVIQVGHYVSPFWKQAFWAGLVGVGVLLLVYTRLIKPWRMKRRPWQVAEVVEEHGGAHTLVLKPRGHEGMPFRAGQYGWITLGDSPFSLQQHPFSFASSAEHPDRICLTAKPLGDFTGTWGDVEAGTGAFLEGPYGTFTLDRERSKGAVLFAGGVGITPFMSMLRTLRDRGDDFPIVLFYANKNWDDVIFREEIGELEEAINLKLVHVLETAPEGWEGEEGLLTAEVLDRHLPDDEPARWTYYLCGPEPMQDLVESELIDRGLPRTRILTERFEIV